MSSFTLPPAPAGPPLVLIDPANHAAAGGGPPVVPGAAARLLYLPNVAVALVFCLIGFAINLDSWRAVTALQAAGAPATAAIVDIDSYNLSKNARLYFITFEYQAAGPGGTPQTYRATDITPGDRREHGRFHLGKPIAVRYLPADPAVARFRESTPPTAWLALFFLAASVALCVLLYFARWCWDDATLRRRGRILPGALISVGPALWPRTQRADYRFTAPDGRELRGSADITNRRYTQAGHPQAGAQVAVLFVHDGLHTLL